MILWVLIKRTLRKF